MLTTVAGLTWPVRTARLTVRLHTLDDVPAVWAWRGLPEVCEWLSAGDQTEAGYAERVAAEPGSVLAEFEGRPVAVGKVHQQDGWGQREVADATRGVEAELGWVLDPAVQGRGLGTEFAGALLDIAFGGLGVRRVVAFCFAANTASWRLMERLGMRREATYVQESLHRTLGWVDSYAYAMLADEWAARRAPQRS